jgi:hypothetical protein
MAISGGMISNPKRSVTVEMSLGAVRKRVKNLYKVYHSIDKSYADNKEDDFMNIYQYKIKDGGLSWGTRAVIILRRETDTTTNIDVELQRMVGSYDTDREVTNANEQMNAIFEGLSMLAQKTDDELNTLTISEDEAINTGIGTFGTIMCIVSLILLIVWGLVRN